VQFVIVLAILTALVFFVGAPLRRVAAGGSLPEGGENNALAELEAAREAKYREIRDAELDHLTGKLSDADYAAVDGTLRAEAVQILRALDTIKER
jgi:hypothetical protein